MIQKIKIRMFALSKYEQAKLFRLNQIRWGHYFNQWRNEVFRVCHHKCLKFESFCPSLWCFRRNGTRFCCRRQFLDGVKRACRCGSDCVSILLQIVRKKGSFCLIVLLRGPLIIVYKRSRWPKNFHHRLLAVEVVLVSLILLGKLHRSRNSPLKLVLNSFWPAE